MESFEKRISGELRFDVPRAWPRDPAAIARLNRRLRALADLIVGVPLEAFTPGPGRRAVRDAVDGFEALWPVPATRPPEIAAAINTVRDGDGDIAG